MSQKLLQLLQQNAKRESGINPIRAEVTDDAVHIYVYDVIDSYWGASAKDLITALTAAAGKTVHLHINSPGGDVFEGRAMAAALAAHNGPLVAYIDGVCASAATYLAMAAGQCFMVDGALFMIHNSWTFTYGDKGELRQQADLLEKIDGQIAQDYAKRSEKPLDDIQQWMDAETWFTPQEALDAGFIDGIESNSKRDNAANVAMWNLTAYSNAPQVQTSAPTEPDLDVAIANQLQKNRNRLRLLAPGI